jgi:hypothetical protein
MSIVLFNSRKKDEKFGGYFSEGTSTKTRHTSLDTFSQEAFDGDPYDVVPVQSYNRKFDKDGLIDPPEFEKSGNQFNLQRTSDGKVVSANTVSKSYEPLGPKELLEALKPWVDQGWASPDSIIIPDNGQTEIFVLRLDGQQLVDGGMIMGEEWDHYAFIKNIQCKGAAFGSLLSRRFDCMNMSQYAAGRASFRITHHTGAKNHFKNAVQNWTKLREQIPVLAKNMGLYLDVPMSDDQQNETVNKVLGLTQLGDELCTINTKGELGTPSTRIKNQREGILEAIAMEVNQTAKPGSAANVLNGITHYATHWQPEKTSQNDTKRLMAFLTGTRGNIEKKGIAAINSVMQLA